MDLLKKIDIMLSDMVVAADVATNTAKGKIDVIGGKCPNKKKYNKKKKVCDSKNESSVVGGSYLGGTTVNIIGSQQTRVWGVKRNDIIDLARKEPVIDKKDDPTETNILGRKGLKFDKESGAYVPSLWSDDE